MSATAEDILKGRQEHLEMLAAAYLKKTNLPANCVVLLERHERGQTRFEFVPKIDEKPDNAVRLLVDARLEDFLENAYCRSMPIERLLERALDLAASLSVEREELYRQLYEVPNMVQYSYDRCRRN